MNSQSACSVRLQTVCNHERMPNRLLTPGEAATAQASIPKCTLRRVSRGQEHSVDVQRGMNEHQDSLDEAGVDVKAVPTNPEHADRGKAAQALQLGRKGLLAEVIVWTSGECDVLYGDDPRAVSVHHPTIRSQEDLEALMSELLAMLYLNVSDS